MKKTPQPRNRSSIRMVSPHAGSCVPKVRIVNQLSTRSHTVEYRRRRLPRPDLPGGAGTVLPSGRRTCAGRFACPGGRTDHGSRGDLRVLHRETRGRMLPRARGRRGARVTTEAPAAPPPVRRPDPALRRSAGPPAARLSNGWVDMGYGPRRLPGLRDWLTRLFPRSSSAAFFRLRVEGLDRLPPGSGDPVLQPPELDRPGRASRRRCRPGPRLYFFGPKEARHERRVPQPPDALGRQRRSVPARRPRSGRGDAPRRGAHGRRSAPGDRGRGADPCRRDDRSRR